MSCCRKEQLVKQNYRVMPYCLSESTCNFNISANFQDKGSKTWLSDYPHALQCSSDLFISYFSSYAQFHQENSQGLTISSVVSWLWIMLPVKMDPAVSMDSQISPVSFMYSYHIELHHVFRVLFHMILLPKRICLRKRG